MLDDRVAELERANAELQRKLDERTAALKETLEQQTATAAVLQVINSSPGNLAPVFDAMLEKAMRLCGAAFGELRTYDGERFNLAAVNGVPSTYVEYYRAHNTGIYGSGTGPPQLLAGKPLVHIPDLTATEPYQHGDPDRRALVDLGGARAYLMVPLLRDRTVLSYIMIYRQEQGSFSDKQIALLQNFAAQAVVAMENARLLTETREALEQQTATAEVLQVINSSPGDLAPVLDAILEKAMQLCEAAFGVLLVPDGELQRAIAHRSLSPALAEYLDRPVHGGVGLVGRLQAGEAAVQIADAADDEIYRAGAPSRRAIVDLGGARTAMAVALRKDGTYLGAFWLYRQEVRPFTDKQIGLLQNFAAKAVIAMENARLLNELRERTKDLQQSLEHQTATSDVLKVISRSTSDVLPVLDTLVETAARLCRSDSAAIAIREGEVYRYVSNTHSGAADPEYFAAMRQRTIVPGRDSVAGLVALEGRVVHVADIRAIPDYAFPEGVRSGRRTVLGVPLLREGAVLGTINLSRKRVEPFSERQIELVRTFADQAVIAMENARLLGELRQRTEEVAELNRGLEARVAEQVEELGRVGRLKRFLAPQLAELIVSQGDEKILESHRREIVVVFCDLRGYTAFTETAEPEEVLDFLREYHGALGPLVSQFEGTLDQFSGDGIMVFFNDPVPIPDPAERAVRMAIAMGEVARALIADWRRRDRELGFGAGIAQGYATLGQIGFAERSGYTAIGTVCNLAARLCAEAKDGQILIAGRVAAAVEKVIAFEDLGSLTLKGLTQPVSAFNVPLAATPPALRVIEGGPQSV